MKQLKSITMTKNPIKSLRNDKNMNSMNKEQKEFLLKDLCARLPYGVKGVNIAGIVTTPSDWYCGFVRLSKELENRICFSDWKPYLLPLSSMTEKQRKEYDSIIYHNVELHADRYYEVIDVDSFELLHDFYHKNHFDYRGLISMGLAIDATNLKIY